METHSTESTLTSYPSSVATVDWDAIPSHDDIERDQRSISKRTLLGMVFVAVGTALFCTVGAIVQEHGGSVLQLMMGRYMVQNLISWCIWFGNPWNIKKDAVYWYGDRPHRKNIWARGFFLFLTVFCWWRGLELVPLGNTHSLFLCSLCSLYVHPRTLTLSAVPSGDGEAILFLNPIVTVLAARYLLKEELPSTFFLTTVLNLAGLTFICQPSFLFESGTFGDFQEFEERELSWKGILFLIASVMAWSTACLLVRSAKDAHWMQVLRVYDLQFIVFIFCDF